MLTYDYSCGYSSALGEEIRQNKNNNLILQLMRSFRIFLLSRQCNSVSLETSSPKIFISLRLLLLKLIHAFIKCISGLMKFPKENRLIDILRQNALW